jgi:hypothetical protein
MGLTLASEDVHRPATRAEVIRTVLNAFGTPIDDSIVNSFTDLPSNHPDAAVILTAAKLGIISGDSYADGSFKGTVRPNDPINRAEIAKIIVKMLGD